MAAAACLSRTAVIASRFGGLSKFPSLQAQLLLRWFCRSRVAQKAVPREAEEINTPQFFRPFLRPQKAMF